MTVFVRPFKASDLGAFVPIEPLSTDEIKDPELAKAIEDSKLAVTGIKDGRIVGCGGVHPVDDVHGELWLRLSKDCLKHKLDTLRWLKSGFKIIEETFPFRQLNAVIRCDYERGKKLAEWLGLKQVQFVEKDNKRYAVYAKLVRN